MSFLVYITSFSVMIHAAQPYILLTANLDDLHNIAKELVQSPASDQIGSLVRRAYNELQKMDLLGNRNYQPRADDDDGFRRNINKEETSLKNQFEETTGTLNKVDKEEVVKNEKEEKEKETYYIKSINKVLENV